MLIKYNYKKNMVDIKKILNLTQISKISIGHLKLIAMFY